MINLLCSTLNIPEGCLTRPLTIHVRKEGSIENFDIAKSFLVDIMFRGNPPQIINNLLKTMAKSKFPSKLHARTLELFLKAPRKLTNTKISDDVGLSKAWLTDFSKNRIIEPPAGKLEALYNYLSSTPFEI
jgi:hypothetical protein